MQASIDPLPMSVRALLAHLRTQLVVLGLYRFHPLSLILSELNRGGRNLVAVPPLDSARLRPP
jgi:hypothetical protein